MKKKKGKMQGGLADCFEPNPAPRQDDDNLHPAEEQGDTFCLVAMQADTAHPAAMQGSDTCP